MLLHSCSCNSVHACLHAGTCEDTDLCVHTYVRTCVSGTGCWFATVWKAVWVHQLTVPALLLCAQKSLQSEDSEGLHFVPTAEELRNTFKVLGEDVSKAVVSNQRRFTLIGKYVGCICQCLLVES